MKHWIVSLVFGLAVLTACSDVSEPKSKSQNTSSSQPRAESRAEMPAPDPNRLEQLKVDFEATPFKVLRIAEQIYDGGPAMAITFSVPLDPKLTLDRYMVITDDKGQPVDGSWILGQQLNTAYFPFIEAESTYRVRVEQGLPALNGRLLERNKMQTVRTARKQRQVRFVSHGAQLSPTLSDGLVVEAINVEAIDIDFHRVEPDQLARFLKDYLGNSYYEIKRIQQYSSLVYSARFDLNYVPNKKRQSLLPIKNLAALAEPGIYISVMKPAGDYPYNYQVTWFSISDLGFQLRQYPQQVVAFTHRVDSATPVAKVLVQLYDQNGRVLQREETDQQGFATFSSRSTKAAVATAEHKGQLALLKLNSAALDLSEFRLPTRQQHPLELFLYAPRDLYRPGETAIINALLRDNDARLIDAQDIQVAIKQPDGRTFQSFVWRGDEQSFYEHQFKLPQSSQTGEWTFQATLGNGDVFRYPFKVEDFLPERMKLVLTSSQSALMKNETPSISIQGDYLYGAPAAGNRVQATLIVRQARTLFEKWQDFVFGVDNYRNFDRQIDLPPLQLDQSGQARLQLNNHWQNTQHPLRLTTRVSLFESGGRPVSRSIEQIVWPKSHLVAVRPLWDDDVATPNKDVAFEIIHVDALGQPAPSDELELVLIREDMRYYWRWDGGWNYQQSGRNVPVYNRVISLGEDDERLTVSMPVEYGNYRLEIRDKRQTLLSSYRFFAGWRWDKSRDGNMGRPDMAQLKWDKAGYQPTEQAKLSINAPYDGVALVTLEANELLWQTSVEVKNNRAEVTIPISDSWQRHDIYATVNVIRAGSASRKDLPKRALGLLHLPLDRSDRQLSVTLDAPEKILPDSQLITRIRVSGAQQSAVNVTLAAVDTGVLSLSQFETPRPHDWFFAERQYQTDIRDTWGKLIEQLSDKPARQRFGGDSDALSRGGDAPQSDVQVVSLYSGKVTLNQQGEAEIPLQLPYFNGELRLMALAFSNNAFGHQEQRIKVAAPLIAEVSTPRFLAQGDQSSATFDLQNLTDRVQQLAVEIAASPALGGQVSQHPIQLEPQQKKVLQLPLLAQAATGVGKVSLTVVQQNEAESEPVNLKREWMLGLRSPYAAETRLWNRVLSSGERFELPKDFNSGLQKAAQHLVLNVSPKPPFNANEHLNHLVQYPYGCLEQTTSRAWPLLMLSGEQLKAFDRTQNQTIASQHRILLNGAISRILGMQRSDGGFGLWSNQSPENHWLTVFATDFLLRANDAGFSVDAAALDKAMKRLQRYLSARGKLWSENQHYTSWPDHYHLSYRSYAAMVLANRQQARLADLRNLYDKFHGHAKTRLPLAQLALALELAGDVRRSQQAWRQAFTMGAREMGYAGDYGSSVRDLANTTVLASRSKLVEDPWQLIFDLRDALMDRRWLSTQERFALFQLANQFDQTPNRSWQMSLQQPAKQTEKITSSDNWLRHFIESDIPTSLTLSNTHDQSLYMTMTVQGYPVDPPAPVNDGIQLQRSFYTSEGKSVDLKRIESGDLLLVRIDLQSQGRRRIPDAMVVDMLPAGLELENQNLESAVKIDAMTVAGKTVSQWMASAQIKHQEYRDDRYVAAVDLDGRKTTSVFYLARAVTPGIYKLPATQAEDMYRPYLRAIGETQAELVILPKPLSGN